MIDQTSYQILKILQEKARIPNAEVARQVNMAPSAVLERIRKLENQGVIDGYEVRLNPKRFDRAMVAFIRVFADGFHGRIHAIGQSLKKLADILEVHFIAGEDCFLVKARVADTAMLNRLVNEDINTIDGVTRTCTSIALETLKETWQIPLE